MYATTTVIKFNAPVAHQQQRGETNRQAESADRDKEAKTALPLSNLRPAENVPTEGVRIAQLENGGEVQLENGGEVNIRESLQ